MSPNRERGGGAVTDSSRPIIMVVDDQPDNLKLLEDMLRQQGYGVRAFPRGRFALASAAQQPPDVILLDINMPEMTGYEVCERLRQDARLSSIPVIFLSALDDVEDKVRAFQSGGVDFITKPFQVEEVQARVKTHAELYRLQRLMQQRNEQLEELVADRTRELEEAHARLKVLDQSKTEFLNLLSHELRTPLAGVLGIGDLLLATIDPGAHEQQLRGAFEQSSLRINSILDDALVLARIDFDSKQFTPRLLPVAALLGLALEHARELAASREVRLQASREDLGEVLGVQELLVKALQGMVEAAVKFSHAGQTVRVTAQRKRSTLELTLDSVGHGVPEKFLPRFFELFAISEDLMPGGDIGLAAYVSARIFTLFGGSVAVRNRDASGIQLTVLLKLAAAAVP